MDDFNDAFKKFKQFYNVEPGFEDGGRVGFAEGKRANQYSKMRTLEELQKIIDNAPQIKVGDKFLNMNAKDFTGESEVAKEYNRNPNYPGRKKGIEYISRREMDKFGKKGTNELVFEKTGKQSIKDKRRFIYSENLKGLQPSGLNYKGDPSKNLIHPYPKVIETTTGTTGEGNARINRSLSGYDKKARPIAVKQVELIKNKENMSPDDFNKERMKLNAQAKQVRENIVSKKGNIAKNYTGYYRVNEQGIFEPKGFNAKKSFAGIGGEDIKFNDMTKDQLIKFKEQNLNYAKKLKDLGFKCTVKKANGGPASCNNPLAYLDDIKKQEALAKTGKGPQAAKALKKVSAGRKIFSAVLGPEALAPELALIVPFAVADYKAGLPNQEILSNATLGLFGKSRNRRRDELAVKQGYDTKELKRSRDFDAAAEKYGGDISRQDDFMGPDDLYQFPQQINKSKENFYKTIDPYAGNKEIYNRDVKRNEDLEEIMRLEDQRKAEDIKRRAQKSMEGPIDSFFASGGIAGILKK